MRRRLGLTQAQLASKIGCGQNSVSRYEDGALPSIEILSKVWRLADQTERFLLHAYLSELFSDLPTDYKEEVLREAATHVPSMAGVAQPEWALRIRLLHDRHRGDESAERLFERAVDWLEVELSSHDATKPKRRRERV